ncbi:MAG TPA: flagellar basal-body MS-ring/collar protein FliF [Bryobacteraceae bacterium]|jgi:flagellar M-ring protein FliF
MNQLTQLWNRLSWGQRIWIAVAIAAVVGGITALNHWNEERNFKPLFSGLAPEDAGGITAKLRELGVEYRLADEGSAILVPSEKVAETRLDLASAGLPKSGRIGFELFDKTNFGASEFTEQVNYHRAIEGELERSVMSIREVEQARVHVTMAKDSLYTEQREPAKASVLVKLRHAAALSPQNIAAICQLTASAVPGLSAEQVSLVDTNGNLLNRPRLTGGDADHDDAASIELRKSVERDLQTKIAETLDPLLGQGHFRVGVSADLDRTSGEQSEETYDPQKSALASSQTTQDGPALASASGVPGTASNVPNATAKAEPSGASSTNYSRHTENVAYQTSRVVKHIKMPQGTLRKLSVSVLVDHSLHWEGTKRIVEPPSPEKMKVIHDLVSAAAGLDTNRGDQLVVEAFAFESTLSAEPPVMESPEKPPPPSPLPPWLQKLIGNKSPAVVAGIAGGIVLVLVAGLVFALKGRGKKKKAPADAAPAGEQAQPKELPPAGGEAEKQVQAKIAAHAAEQERKNAAALAQLKLPTGTTNKTEVLTKHIAAEAKKDPVVIAQVVRSWLHGDH